MFWISSAPANLMLLGEHSVVYGYPAMACAVNQRIEIHWSKTTDKTLCIESELANFQFTLDELKAFKQHPELDHPKLRFVMHALNAFAKSLNHGLQIKIVSEFSSTLGLGSSAAVLAASLHGLNQITEQNLNTLELFQLGHEIILGIQGRGSGTDLAASLSGGVILFEPALTSEQISRPANIQTLPESITQNLALSLVYCGYKTPTGEVLKHVSEQWQAEPEQLNRLYALMGETTKQACQTLLDGKLEHFYALCEVYQDLMDALGVNDETLQSIIDLMRQCSGIHASKISGSGLGDCVLGFGNLTDCSETIKQSMQTFTQLNVDVTFLGAHTDFYRN
ncbi:MAG: GHMP kinase [Thiotrichales bacterium]|nr:GHMP kinase [Thiotrichales bacterium]